MSATDFVTIDRVTSAPTRIVLDELDAVGVGIDLDEATAVALERTSLVELRPIGTDRWRVLPRGMVGAAQVGHVLVQVTPKDKVGLSRLLFLLGYASDPGFQPEDVAAVDEPDLLPALAESLARQGERALRGGVLQGYVTIDDSLRTVRGRIRLGDQISRRPGMLLPLEVAYDDYTVDIAENRILRTAVRRMLAVPRLRSEARARLAHIDAQLSGVHILPLGAPLPRWSRGRLNERYRPALRLSDVVLRHCSAEPGPGALRSAAFVVSMWQVYEDFVTTALTEALTRCPGMSRKQYPDWLDEAASGRPRAVAIKPDLLHLVRGKPVLVVDAKYKAASPTGRYPNADHYQMLAYCTAFGLRRAWLVYAQGGQPVIRRIRNTDISIVEYPLGLGASPRDLLAQIDELAAEIWTHRAYHAG